MAVASMRRADYVAFFNRGNSANRDGFLACVEMRSALDDILAEEVINFFLEKSYFVNRPKPVDNIFEFDDAVINKLFNRWNRFFSRILKNPYFKLLLSKLPYHYLA